MGSSGIVLGELWTNKYLLKKFLSLNMFNDLVGTIVGVQFLCNMLWDPTLHLVYLLTEPFSTKEII